MRASTANSEAMVLGQRKVVCPLWLGGVLLPQGEEVKYFWLHHRA